MITHIVMFKLLDRHLTASKGSEYDYGDEWPSFLTASSRSGHRPAAL